MSRKISTAWNSISTATALIDEFDRSIISMNQGAAVPTVTLSADQAAPQIQASLSNDTGRSNTDGITNDLAATINGSISDNGTIASFTARLTTARPWSWARCWARALPTAAISASTCRDWRPSPAPAQAR